MRVAHLSLTDFRNYHSVELPLAPGPNLIVGKNGQGKTNLLEAMGYFSALRSHRVSSDAAMVHTDADFAVMRMRVIAGEREVVLEAQLNRTGANRAQISGRAVRSRELARWFSSIIFAPEDLSIVRGEPAQRRRFIDDALAARLPVATHALQDYERIVKQRTTLLKSVRGGGDSAAIDATLTVWDDQLIEHGVSIMLARRELLLDLAEPLKQAYSELVDADHEPNLALDESVLEAVGMAGIGNVSRETAERYASTTVSRETLTQQFREAVRAVRARELDRGVTLVGPHRDDLILTLNGLPVRGFASHGESWSYALSLKIALANVLRAESSAGDPVIMLDDVFAELDSGRRQRLMRAVDGFEQVIVTAAVPEDVPEGLQWTRVLVSGGEIQSEESDE